MNIYPTEPGIYWARSDSKTKTYNMIVIIKGGNFLLVRLLELIYRIFIYKLNIYL